MPKIETPTDNRFVQNFIKNGGKFLYSENENEVNKNIALIIEENGWKKSSLFSLDKEISKKFKLDYSFSKNSKDETTCLISTCEYLIADDGSILISSNQVAEKKLNEFIDQIKKEFKLENRKICLAGFSQGCMMSINLGLISDQKYCCVVGFSGKIIDQENLKSRKKVSTDILLVHGELDQVVPANFMLEAKDFFIRNNVEIETHLIKDCDHHIPVKASSIALNYILKKFNTF